METEGWTWPSPTRAPSTRRTACSAGRRRASSSTSSSAAPSRAARSPGSTSTATADWSWRSHAPLRATPSLASQPTERRRCFNQEEASHTREVRAVDLDGDGRQELLWATEGHLDLQRFGKQGMETLLTLPQETLTEGIAFADADGDGDLDLAVCNRNGDVKAVPGEPGGSVIQGYLQTKLKP